MVKEIELAYGERKLLNKVSLTLDENSRAALAGANGAGKSTLLKIIAGGKADSGEITASKDLLLSYMSQDIGVRLSLTLLQLADSAFARFYAKEEAMAALDSLADDESLLKRSLLQDELMHSNFYRREGLIDATLIGLGFKRPDFNKQLSHFSSGWHKRAMLAKVLLEDGDILLLDEPSNYLDLESSAYLLDWLKRFRGGVLMVSHDRDFLDKASSETLELFNGQIKRYNCNYSNYEKRRQAELEQLVALQAQQAERKEQILNFVNKYGAKASKAAQAQSRLKELDKIDFVQLPPALQKVTINFPPPPPCGERVLYMENLAKSYGYKEVFSGLTLLAGKGEKIAVVGPNGAGKSSLLRIIGGYDKKNFAGFLKYGAGVEVGYFSEDTHEPFIGKTVLEELEAAAAVSKQAELRNLLAAFLFRDDDVHKPVAGLSGGERARLLLLKLFLKPFNLLVLDEPTNHLDIQAKDALLNALQNYGGTLLFVSHDRYFLQKLAQYILKIDSTPKFYNGGFTYYEEQVAKETFGGSLKVNNEVKVITNNQLQRQEGKRQATEERRRERREAELLKQIEDLETQKNQLEELLTLPEVYSNGLKVKDIQEKITKVTGRLTASYTEWEQLTNN